MQEIEKRFNLEEVEDWEALARWLGVSRADINTIIENCDISNTKAQCYRRELVKTHCDQRGGDPERVKEDIRYVLESKMGTKKQGWNYYRVSQIEGVVCVYRKVESIKYPININTHKHGYYQFSE